MAVGLLGIVSSAYGAESKEAQEVQAQIAAIIIEVYAIESGLARADRLASRGDSRASLAADAAHVYEGDAADRIAAAAKQVVAALIARGGEPSLASHAAQLYAYTPVDPIAARRRIADAVIAAGKHSFYTLRSSLLAPSRWGQRRPLNGTQPPLGRAGLFPAQETHF